MSHPVTDQLMGRINRQMAIALDAAMEDMASDLREEISGPPPSSAGDYPAKRSGALAGSVHVQRSQISQDRVTASVDTNTPYDEFVNKGTSRMEPRPFSELISAKWEPIVSRRLQEAAASATTEATIDNPTDFFSEILSKGLEPNRTSL